MTDRSFILLQLRLNSFGSKLVVTEDDKDFEIDLEKHVKDCLGKVQSPGKRTFNVKIDSINITCEVPQLNIDTKINKQFTKAAKKGKGSTTPLQLTDLIGD